MMPRVAPDEAIAIALTIAGVPHATAHSDTVKLVLTALRRSGWRLEPAPLPRAQTATPTLYAPLRIPAVR